MKTLLVLTIAFGLYAETPTPVTAVAPATTVTPDAKVKILETRIAKLQAQIVALTSQSAVLSGALTACQQPSQNALQQAAQAEATALKEAGDAAKCASGLDPDTLTCKSK